MTQKPWKDWTDEELTNEAQTGIRGLGANVEAMRRLREAVHREQHATTILTYVLVVFAVIQKVVLVFQ